MEELQKNGMMAHLLASLEAGKDIGHYGRLVFAMVARHFLTPEELVAMLTKDSDFSESQAKLLVRQVEGKDYNPPKRDRVLAWQKEQEFPICPNPEDPDSCNVYKDLNFPDHVYEHIQDYVEQKAESGS
jgi:DNA primase large subunit